MAQQAAAVIEKTQQQPPATTPGNRQDAPQKEAAREKDPYADKSKPVRIFHHHIKPILIVAIVLLSARSSLLDWNDVPTGSMKPTILEGDRIFVNKLAYDLKVPFTTWHLAEWGNPQRGEIAVFYSPENGIRLVKRVIGTPGDVLELRDNVLYVNGIAATYRPLSQDVIDQIPPDLRSTLTFATEVTADGMTHPVMKDSSRSSDPKIKRSFEKLTIPPGKYFLMGDNRDNSNDSRYWGFADRDLIVGRAFAVAVSLDPDHSYKPRWGRFFKGFAKGETKGEPAK